MSLFPHCRSAIVLMFFVLFNSVVPKSASFFPSATHPCDQFQLTRSNKYSRHTLEIDLNDPEIPTLQQRGQDMNATIHAFSANHFGFHVWPLRLGPLWPPRVLLLGWQQRSSRLDTATANRGRIIGISIVRRRLLTRRCWNVIDTLRTCCCCRSICSANIGGCDAARASHNFVARSHATAWRSCLAYPKTTLAWS